VTALLDTNVLIRHLTGDPAHQAQRATAYLSTAAPGVLILLDPVTAEIVYVLQKVYQQPRHAIGRLIRSALGLPAIRCDNAARLYRTVELFELGMDFVDAYVLATAEVENIPEIVSFDRGIRPTGSVRRIEP